MATIKHPFGTDAASTFYGGTSVLSRIGATATGIHTRTINSVFSYLHCVTATKKQTLKLSIADGLPSGALLHIRKTDSGSGLLLHGDSFERMGQIDGGIGSPTVGKGTGHWMVGFFYNGSKFQPYTIMNLNKLEIIKR
jgi:hypothetical protein